MSMQQIKLSNDAPGMGPAGATIVLDTKTGRVFDRSGKALQLSLAPVDVHDSTELPTYLAGYKNSAYRADEVSKVLLTDHDEGKMRSFASDDTFRRVDVKGSIEGNIPEVDPSSSTISYKVVDRFIGSFINDITEQNAIGSNIRPKQISMARCAKAVLLDREIDVWTMLTTAANWNANNSTTLAAGFQWNGGLSSDPIADLMGLVEDSVLDVGELWMNRALANAMIRHDKVKTYVQLLVGDGPIQGALGDLTSGDKTKAINFALPGLPPIRVVGTKVKNETSGLLEYVLGGHVVAISAVDGIPTDGEEIATTYTVRRRGNVGVGYETREFRVDNRGPKGGTMVVVSQADIAIMTGPTVGGLLRNAYQ